MLLADADAELANWDAHAAGDAANEKLLHDGIRAVAGGSKTVEVTKDKNIRLFRWALDHINYIGPQIAGYVASGFPLVGALDRASRMC